MVRLQQTFSSLDFDTLEESQFHYGSITTYMPEVYSVDGSLVSQFHYGSITTIQTPSQWDGTR